MDRAYDDSDNFFQFDGAGDASSTDDAGHFTHTTAPPRLGILAALSEAEFSTIARAAQLKHVPADTIVFHQGDPADRFFILVDGHVSVERDGTQLAVLDPGSFFGESALLVSGNRSATVRTTDPCSLWSVNYAAFTEVIGPHLLANDATARHITSRLAATSPDHFA